MKSIPNTLWLLLRYMWSYDDAPRTPWDGSWSLFMLRFGATFIFWGPLFVQYAGLYWLKRNVPDPWITPFYLLVPFFVLQNALFNVFVGSFIFWERPRFLQFTSRIQMLFDRGDPRVSWIVEMLNEHDKYHIKRPAV